MDANHDSGATTEGEDAPKAAIPDLQGFEFTFESSTLRFEIDSEDMSDIASVSDMSLSDSIQNYPELFGRTYHAFRAGSYAFPNDELEQERLAIQGPVMERLMGGKLFFAPISTSDPPRYVLDVATGIGDWAIDMADEFPKTTVIATDLSPIQPVDVPPNVRFYIEDATDPWDFEYKFDFIHTRITAGCWSDFETQIAAQAFEALQPGGWFESQEVDCNISCDDGTLDASGPVVSWMSDLILASEKLNRPALIGATLKEAYERVGFVDVQQRVYKMPLGPWPKNRSLKQIGLLWRANLLEGLSAFSYQLLHHGFDRSAAEIEVSKPSRGPVTQYIWEIDRKHEQVSLVDVRRDLCDTRIHSYMPTFVVWGRKPYPSEL